MKRRIEKLLHDPHEIIEQYTKKKLALVAIAKLHKTDWVSIRRVLIENGVPIRPRGASLTVTTSTERRCSVCHVWQPLTNFIKRKSRGKDGRAYICRECQKPIRRNQDLKHEYGITPEQYNRMLAEQNGVCLICQKPQHGTRKTSLHVDHDHQTGKVRGLLCHRCNTTIGLLREDPVIIKRMTTYLKKHHAAHGHQTRGW